MIGKKRIHAFVAKDSDTAKTIDEHTAVSNKTRRVHVPGDDKKRVHVSNTECNESSRLECGESLADFMPETKNKGIIVPETIQSLYEMVHSDNKIDIPTLMGRMLSRERDSRAEIDYVMQGNSESRSKMRVQLVQCMMILSDQFVLGRETFHLAVNFCDRYLAAIYSDNFDLAKQTPFKASDLVLRAASPMMQGSDFYLLAVTCVFVAAKYEEIIFPNLTVIAQGIGNVVNIEQILAMEGVLCSVLNWKLVAQTSYSWQLFYLKKICFIYHMKAQTSTSEEKLVLLNKMEQLVCTDSFTRVVQLLDLATYHNFFFQFLPSFIAIAALCSEFDFVIPLVEEISGYTFKQLEKLIVLFKQFITQIPIAEIKCNNSKILEYLHIPICDLYTRQLYNDKYLAILPELKLAIAQFDNPSSFPLSTLSVQETTWSIQRFIEQAAG